MTVSVTRTSDSTTITWTRADDDRHGYLVQAVDNGRLEQALTALGLSTYEEISDLDEFERAEILRGTAALVTDLTRRVRHLTVAAREDGMTWGTLASNLTGDPHARSTARSTYEAGLRQMGRTGTPSDWPNKPVTKFSSEELADAIERHENSSDPVIRDMVASCIREWERRKGLRNHKD